MRQRGQSDCWKLYLYAYGSLSHLLSKGEDTPPAFVSSQHPLLPLLLILERACLSLTSIRYAFQTKEFKGSVFVEMADVDTAIKATKEEFKSGDNTLQCEMKEAYHHRKKAERNEKKADKKAAGGGGGGAAKEEEKEEPIVEGCVLGFKGVPDDTSREDFKEAFGKYADVSWVDFQRGDTSGEVRFSGPDATKVMEGCKKDEIKINGAVPELHVLTGEAEAVRIIRIISFLTCCFSNTSTHAFLSPRWVSPTFGIEKPIEAYNPTTTTKKNTLKQNKKKCVAE